MTIVKDPKTKKWVLQYRYHDWTGTLKKSTKRGFATKREAEEWYREFMAKLNPDCSIYFRDFVPLYLSDMKNRLREHTMINKTYIINDKLLPYFGDKRLRDITVADIRKWQNSLIQENYSQTYLKTIHNQLSAIFNYAVQYYNFSSNPCKKAGSIGKARADEMEIWTQGEFQKFSDCLMDKRISWMAFQILFWTGIRIGELLALTFADVDLEKKTIRISKSYQRLKGKDVVTPPKTPKSNRTVSIPQFLAEDIQEYKTSVYDPQPDDRVIPAAKTFLEKEMRRGVALSGVKKIRIHDLRHSHASLLIEMGFSAKEIAERLGHENVETTLNIYSHLYPDKQERLAQRLDQYYSEQEGSQWADTGNKIEPDQKQ